MKYVRTRKFVKSFLCENYGWCELFMCFYFLNHHFISKKMVCLQSLKLKLQFMIKLGVLD